MDENRLKVEGIEQKANELTAILENGKPSYIFGTGWMGNRFYETVIELGYPIEGFIVSKRGGSVDTYLEKPLYESTEMLGKDEKGNVFIALRDYDEALETIFQKAKYTVRWIQYPEDLANITGKSYMNYFQGKGIDLFQNIIKIKGYFIVNPFLKSVDYLLSWLYEVGDLILPIIFMDETRLDEGPYEYKHVCLEQGDTVIDCGANIGLFTSIAAQKGCHVYAFEPMVEVRKYLEEVEVLFKGNVEICPYAVGSQKGFGEFRIQNNDLLGASLLENHNLVDKEYQVEIKTIDDFVEENNIRKVDFLKADIEGSERDMLFGAKKTIQRDCPKISICTYHLEDDMEVLERIIKEINSAYVVEHKWKKLYAYVP